MPCLTGTERQGPAMGPGETGVPALVAPQRPPLGRRTRRVRSPVVAAVLYAAHLAQTGETVRGEPILGQIRQPCPGIVHPPGRLCLPPGGVGLPELSDAPAQGAVESLAPRGAHPDRQVGLTVQPFHSRVVGSPLLGCKVTYPLRQFGRIDDRQDHYGQSPFSHKTSRYGSCGDAGSQRSVKRRRLRPGSLHNESFLIPIHCAEFVLI